jgi:hypothetical protein
MYWNTSKAPPTQHRGNRGAGLWGKRWPRWTRRQQPLKLAWISLLAKRSASSATGRRACMVVFRCLICRRPHQHPLPGDLYCPKCKGRFQERFKLWLMPTFFTGVLAASEGHFQRSLRSAATFWTGPAGYGRCRPSCSSAARWDLLRRGIPAAGRRATSGLGDVGRSGDEPFALSRVRVAVQALRVG